MLSYRPPPTRSCHVENYEHSDSHILAHSKVRRRLRVRPGPMAHRVALSYFYPTGQWRSAPRSHDAFLCALQSFQALNPGECRHHWRPDIRGNRTSARRSLQLIDQVFILNKLYLLMMRLTKHSCRRRMSAAFAAGRDFLCPNGGKAGSETITPRSYCNKL